MKQYGTSGKLTEAETGLIHDLVQHNSDKMLSELGTALRKVVDRKRGGDMIPAVMNSIVGWAVYQQSHFIGQEFHHETLHQVVYQIMQANARMLEEQFVDGLVDGIKKNKSIKSQGADMDINTFLENLSQAIADARKKADGQNV